MSNSLVRLILPFAEITAPLVLFLVGLAGVILGLRIRRWYPAAGGFIAAGSGLMASLLLMNFLTTSIINPRFLHTYGGYDDSLLHLLSYTSIFTFAVGLGCQFVGIWLLAKRCRELQLAD
jgi:hypothetical protein